MRKVVTLAVLGALALGCGSADVGTATSGLKGRVMRGPIQPVCRVNEPCDEPSPGVKLLFDRSGKLVARTTTNQKGWYRVTLTPGTYTVRTNRPSQFEKVPDPSRVTVPSGRVKRVDFQIDTGIR
jgi:hypothetical protein